MDENVTGIQRNCLKLVFFTKYHYSNPINVIGMGGECSMHDDNSYFSWKISREENTWVT